LRKNPFKCSSTHGADINVKDKLGFTPYEEATTYATVYKPRKEVADYLRRHGGHP